MSVALSSDGCRSTASMIPCVQVHRTRSRWPRSVPHHVLLNLCHAPRTPARQRHRGPRAPEHSAERRAGRQSRSVSTPAHNTGNAKHTPLSQLVFPCIVSVYKSTCVCLAKHFIKWSWLVIFTQLMPLY